MSFDHTPLAAPLARSARQSRRQAGDAAGFLLFSMIAAIILAAVWGALRPGYTGVVHQGAFVVDELASPRNVDFTSFVTFALVTGLFGALLGMAAFVVVSRAQGVGTMLWAVIVAAVCAVVVYLAGGIVSEWLHPFPDLENLADGTTTVVVPNINPGVGWAAGPFLAALTYWVAAVVVVHNP